METSLTNFWYRMSDHQKRIEELEQLLKTMREERSKDEEPNDATQTDQPTTELIDTAGLLLGLGVEGTANP